MKWVRFLIFLGLIWVGRSDSFANEYEGFVDISDEQDLHELLETGQIGEDTFDILLQIYQQGMDINTATRGELYSLPNLSYAEVDAILEFRAGQGVVSPVDLVTHGVVSSAKARAIAPFLVAPKQVSHLGLDGSSSLQTRWTITDRGAPPFALRTRVQRGKKLRFGVATILTRNRLGTVAYDVARDALSAKPPTTTIRMPKLYGQYESDNYQVVIGTFRAGFGQRLTFDNTQLFEPKGFYPDGVVTRRDGLVRKCKESAGELSVSPCGTEENTYISPDFRWSEDLTGIGVAAKNISLSRGILQSYGFLSLQKRSIYQYEVYNRRICADPRSDTTECAAPEVFRRNTDVFAPTSRFIFHTLPGMYRETTFGGHVGYRWGSRGHAGITAYGARVDWQTEGVDLDFQEWSRRPFGGPFGAVGIDAAWGRRWFDGFLEVARSFDSMEDGGGGVAALLRTVANWSQQELETSLRYYQTGFANPYARSVAASDEFEGLRVRDEVGVRVRYQGQVTNRLELQGTADVWWQFSSDTPKASLYGRADIAVSSHWSFNMWSRYQNRNLRHYSHQACFDVGTSVDLEEGEPILCQGGQEIQLSAGTRLATRRWRWDAQLRGALVDDVVYESRFRRDITAMMSASVRPSSAWRIRLRSRYLFEDISDNTRLEQSLRIYLDVSHQLTAQYHIRVRYDLGVGLDNRPSFADRDPSPESWFWLELASRF